MKSFASALWTRGDLEFETMVLRQLREYQADDEKLSGLVEMVDGLFFLAEEPQSTEGVSSDSFPTSVVHCYDSRAKFATNAVFWAM
jgi:hypothetical protein